MPEKLIAHEGGVALPIPPDLVERYHLAPGVEMEVQGTDQGITLVPLGVPQWFSFEWERALDGVVQRYGRALQMLREVSDQDEAAGGPASGPEQPGENPA